MNESIKKAWEALKRAKDEVQLKAHLGSKEGSDFWEQSLKPELDKLLNDIESFGQKFGATFEQSHLEAHLGMMELKERFEKIHQATHELSQDIQSKGQPTVDWMRLKAHLAQMDAMDKAEELKPSVEEAREVAKKFLNSMEEASHKVCETVSGKII